MIFAIGILIQRFRVVYSDERDQLVARMDVQLGVDVAHVAFSGAVGYDELLLDAARKLVSSVRTRNDCAIVCSKKSRVEGA